MLQQTTFHKYVFKTCCFLCCLGTTAVEFLVCFSGLPVLIVGVTLAVSVDEYKADDHCWLNVKTDTIWAFVGPVMFVLMVCYLIYSSPDSSV